MNTKHSTLNLTRRNFFKDCGVGTGKIALASLLAGGTNAGVSRADDSFAGHVRPHHTPAAKAVIHLFMAGAPSQLELFNEKPLLKELEGQPLPDLSLIHI